MAAHQSLVITTARKASAEVWNQAQYWSQLLGARVVPREGRRLETICAQENVQGVLVLGHNRPTYYEPTAGLEFFFHPNTAAIRIRNIATGTPDHMIQAMGLREGDHVLDCTMGRAGDAIICAYVVGETGRVVALEKVPVIAYLTIEGLRTGWFVSPRFTALMRRVDARCADYHDFLPRCQANSFDVVYFDPIFHRPIEKSQSMTDLRVLAEKESLTPPVVQEALRVARRCVVIKQHKGTPLWQELGVTTIVGGKQSRVEYGVLQKSREC